MEELEALYLNLTSQTFSKSFSKAPSSSVVSRLKSGRRNGLKNPNISFQTIHQRIQDGTYLKGGKAGKGKRQADIDSANDEAISAMLKDVKEIVANAKVLYPKNDRNYSNALQLEEFIESMDEEGDGNFDGSPKDAPEDDQEEEDLSTGDEADEEESVDSDAAFYGKKRKKDDDSLSSPTHTPDQQMVKRLKRSSFIQFRYEEFDELERLGVTYRPGEFVYILNQQDIMTPLIGRIHRIWQVNKEIQGATVNIFFRAKHMDQKNYPNSDPREVLLSGLFRNHYLEELCGKCCVLHVEDFVKGKPTQYSSNNVYFVKNYFDHLKGKVAENKTLQIYLMKKFDQREPLELESHSPNTRLPVVSVKKSELEQPDNSDDEDEKSSRRNSAKFRCSFDASCPMMFENLESLIMHFPRHLPNQQFSTHSALRQQLLMKNPSLMKQTMAMSSGSKFRSPGVNITPRTSVSNSISFIPNSGMKMLASSGKGATRQNARGNNIPLPNGNYKGSNFMILGHEYPIRFTEVPVPPAMMTVPRTNTPELDDSVASAFECSSDGHMLWFASPPVNIEPQSRAMDEPLHSLDYYLFKQKKKAKGSRRKSSSVITLPLTRPKADSSEVEKKVEDSSSSAKETSASAEHIIHALNDFEALISSDIKALLAS